MSEDKRLELAAQAVMEQIRAGYAVPVSDELAAYMGLRVDPAVSWDDFGESFEMVDYEAE